MVDVVAVSLPGKVAAMLAPVFGGGRLFSRSEKLRLACSGKAGSLANSCCVSAKESAVVVAVEAENESEAGWLLGASERVKSAVVLLSIVALLGSPMNAAS